MKNVLGVTVVSALVFAGSTCMAADGMYVKGIGKFVMPSDPSIENSMSKTIMVVWFWSGRRWNILWTNGVRIEGEISTQKTDLDAISLRDENAGASIGSGDIRMTTYMVNGYFDLPISNGGFGIYITGGLGYGTVTLSVYDVDGDDGGFAWKGGAGMFYNFNDNMTVDLGWEYVSMDDADVDVEVSDLTTNNIVAAFRFAF